MSGVCAMARGIQVRLRHGSCVGRPQRRGSALPVVCSVSVDTRAPPSPTKASSISEGPVIYIGSQRAHSLHQRGKEVFQDMSGWAEYALLPMLKSSTSCWQPNDFLPDSSDPDFLDQVKELRKNASDLPNDYMVVLVGDMVTEEALPSYMNMLNLLDMTKDETGAQEHPWARWTRGWTSEENRHGDLLNKYLYASGRVDMRSVEVTIQNLIASGLDPKLENNPYLCFVYTSFQERATKISHGNTARLAAEYGDESLCKICGVIAADESRHEAAYTRIVDQVFKRDPEGAVMAFADMMKKRIVMPAHLCDDGLHSSINGGRSLFADYATVAQNTGVYTGQDYVDIVEHLLNKWKVQDLSLHGEAAKAQEFLMTHPQKMRALLQRAAERSKRRDSRRQVNAKFSWISGQELLL